MVKHKANSSMSHSRVNGNAEAESRSKHRDSDGLQDGLHDADRNPVEVSSITA